ncbi:MAG: isoprenylcysteine carboxylmethyltransferase family protein [Halomonas sp.]|uniref:Isoprenylcysteine carboxylmethyltransferase family protein n=1 Tax=Halomonas sulfidivorans TaxID=2733488 RepID=A0ABX7WEQ3_9GAMM|nr:isoprenylcysteine carboxylmethyltransferase family protein [Halomonas sulfidivorans]MDX5377555.1 isoprenylcysteine carboxylmethyltransferase family protein [Halomonas sp.]QTP58456.1 isoprenylcysteine carboxylmethyltransferase family protein [Halomonas sulfidivorans]
MNAGESAYGLWMLVILNSVVFVFFAFSFIKPRSEADWRSLGAFSAFVVALFVEMYGFPLTIYFLAGWLARRFPDLDPFSHESGHLLQTLLSVEGDPHFNLLHIASNLIIVAGFLILASAWRVLHQAQQRGELAMTGWYARCRHPQYAAFILIMLGFLLQWPTLVTVVMFPILVVVYVRLARHEEHMALVEFGEVYRAYIERTPRFIPRLSPKLTTHLRRE